MMEMSPVVEYLTAAKKALGSSSRRSGGLHVVMGNEACDLDSAVSAVAYAFLRHSAPKETGGEDGGRTAVVPVLNIPREDYSLRTEVAHWLGRHRIFGESLIFRDDLDLTERHGGGGLLLTLVDHNLLPPADAHLQPAVVFVLDHHRLERQPDEGQVTGGIVLEMVGSCSTLVAERIFQQNPSLLDPVTSSLLYGTILLDTVNLNEAAKRVTPKDVDIIQRLEPYLSPPLSREQVFRELTAAKTDVSGLSSKQLLKKDVKVASGKKVRVGVASLPMRVKEYLRRPDVAKCLSEHSIGQGYDILVIMGYSIAGDVVRRDIAVFSDQEALRSQLVLYLREAHDGNLQLVEMESGMDKCPAFQQQNTAASRKVVLPAIKDWLAINSL